MERTQEQILSQIRQTMDSLRKQMDALEIMIVELEEAACVESKEEAILLLDPIQQEPLVKEPVTEVVIPMPEIEVDQPAEPVAEPVQQLVTESVDEPVQESVAEPILDKMYEKFSWRTAMPGTPVRDIRCAIALVDRASFINYLFEEDPISFQNAINDINNMQSLEEVLLYLSHTHPDWDYSSDMVYRFMMAVRRKINS